MRNVVALLTVVTALTTGCAGSTDGPPPTDAGADAALTMGCSRIDSVLLTCMACHASAVAVASGGGFDMEKPGWDKAMIGQSTPADAPDTDLCKGKNLPRLKPKLEPAQGLFLDKLNDDKPPCGDRMPKLLGKLPAADLACVQAWANSIVAGGTGK